MNGREPTTSSSSTLAIDGPVRTCVGCRQRDAQARLLRVGLCDGQAVPDLRRRLSGRGAYVHPRAKCVERAIRKGGIARSLRAQGHPRQWAQAVVSLQEVAEHFAESK